MSTVFRDLRIWVSRVRECRNPWLLASAINYDRLRRQLLGFASAQPASVTDNYVREIEDDAVFIGEIRDRLGRWTNYQPRAVDFMMSGRSGSVLFNEVTLYSIVRALRPSVAVETGGTPGKSTAFILQAMERNGHGHLYTIDLPPETVERAMLGCRETYLERRPAKAGSNWLVPDRLRGRHTLLIGKSSVHLPPLLAELEYVDLFLHDSDHSYENMMWEFETTWPKVKAGGLLLSDDVLANSSFFDFSRRESLVCFNVFNLGVARAQNYSNR